jgi:hypothetical protein
MEAWPWLEALQASSSSDVKESSYKMDIYEMMMMMM